MEWQDYELLNIIASFLLLLISLVLISRRNSGGPAGVFLKLYFGSFFLTIIISYLVVFQYVLKVPHLFRTGHIFSLLIMPSSYFYVLQNLYPRKLRLYDLLHFLPVLIYLLDYFPVFIMPADQKIQLIKSVNTPQLRLNFGEGWFMPTYGHILIRYTLAAGYCVAQFLLIRRAERTPEHPVVFENPAIIKWMKVLVATECFFFLMPLVSTPFLDPSTISVINTLTGILVSLLQGYYLFFKPEVLYGIHKYPVPPANENAEIGTEVEEKEEYYTDELLDEIGLMLDKYMDTEKPYLKAGYKVSELAEGTGISVHRISAYCNRRKKVNFFGYLNKYRIKYCLDKLSSGEHENKTLEALAEECGFNNRGTFIRVFKSVMEQTPSEYLSTLRKSVSL